MFTSKSISSILSLLLVLNVSTLYADSVSSQDLSLTDLQDFSLDELMNIKVVSINKKEELLKDTAAAIFVLTSEDIRRSGLTSFAELMRLVPGMQVAQKNASTWGVTSRGFNNLRANKLLVMIDGRSVYSPLYAGVFWDQLDYILNDIERIEIIRGPGASIWGANAVNGVVNIITKSAQDTQGVYASARVGVNEKHIIEARIGTELTEDTFFRLYAKRSEYNDYNFVNDGNENTTGDAAGKLKGDSAFDSWYIGSAGFALEHNIGSEDFLSLSGDLYGGKVDDAHNTDDEAIEGQNLNLKWDHTNDDGSNLHLQTYFNHFYRRDGLDSDDTAILRDLYVYDIDAVYTKEISNHTLTVGMGYRFTQDDTNPNASPSSQQVDPKERSDNYYSGFIQDSIGLMDDKLVLTLGTKLEYNSYTNFEVQPNIRLLGHINNSNNVWGAVSRTIRTPSRVESDNVNRGELELDSEKAISYEMGHRLILSDFSLDSTVFYVDHDEIIAIEDDGINDPYSNMIKGQTYGFESALSWKVFNSWKLMGAYTFLDGQFETKTDKIDRFSAVEKLEGTSPQNQFNLRSYWNVISKLEFDTMFYYVSQLKHGVGTGTTDSVPAYSRVDLRLAWVEKNYELVIGAQNLFSDEEPEFSTSSRTATAAPRNYYAELKLRF